MADARHITRRSALTSIAAIPACGLAPIVPAMAEPVDGIMPIFREWEATYRQAGDMTFEEEVALGYLDRCNDLAARMKRIPAKTATEMAAKIIVETAYNDFLLSDIGEGGLMDEALALLA